MWIIIIGMLIGLFLLGMLYISFRAAHFRIINKITNGKKTYARLLCFSVFTALTALLCLYWDLINAMV